MSMEGLIPLVCGAIMKQRRAKKAVDYERLSSAGGAPPTWGHDERFPRGGGAYDLPPRSQSCRFAAPDDERGFSRGVEGIVRALPEGLRDEPLPQGAGDGWRGLSKSRRFSSMRLFGCVSGA